MDSITSGRAEAHEEAAPAPKAAPAQAQRKGLTEQEARYMQGDVPPATSSVLISNSKYLNDPYYRDAWLQSSLRRVGPDLPPTYHIPMMVRGLAEVTDYAAVYRLMEEEKAKNPAFRAWTAERKLTRYDPREMGHYAPGTLGAAIRAFLQRPGFEMEFVSKDVVPQNDIEYYVKRVGNNHDIDHMVTGFGPNAAGEQALALCNITSTARFISPDLAQFMTATQVFVSAAAYKRAAIHYHAVMPAYVDAMQRGIRAGQALRQPLFMVRWEDYLDRQLTDIAAELGIERGPEDEWEWTTAATSG